MAMCAPIQCLLHRNARTLARTHVAAAEERQDHAEEQRAKRRARLERARVESGSERVAQALKEAKGS